MSVARSSRGLSVDACGFCSAGFDVLDVLRLAVQARPGGIADRAAHQAAGQAPGRPRLFEHRRLDAIAHVAVHVCRLEKGKGDEAAFGALRPGAEAGLRGEQPLETDAANGAAASAVDVCRFHDLPRGQETCQIRRIHKNWGPG